MTGVKLKAMFYRCFAGIVVSLSLAVPLGAQLSTDARFLLIKSITAEQAAARIEMPFGTEGVQLTDAGQVNQEDLAKQIKKNGRSIEPGRVVIVTNVELGDRSIVVELDGGGKNKKSIFDRIQVGVGPGTINPQQNPDKDKTKQAKGSKVTLKFAQKVPSDLTPERLKELLNPVLDFTKSNFLRTGIDALPPEFQEAVKAKEARVGMDRSTVILALGRPDDKVREVKDGVEFEDWIYNQRGNRKTYVTFDLNDNVVVSIREYGQTSAAK